METAENDILAVPQSLELIRRAGSSLIERKPLRVRLALYRCPYCGSSAGKRPSRLKKLEKIYGRVLNMRRCRDCGHRYFAPFLLCVRPGTFWAALGLLLALAFCAGIFVLIVEFAPAPPSFKETKYY